MDAMPQSRESDGLCSTCNNEAGCQYKKARGEVLFCEMFDDSVEPAERAVKEARPRRPDAAEEEGKFAGLCVNCSSRHSCMHPKPAGGVWHCEDYE